MKKYLVIAIILISWFLPSCNKANIADYSAPQTKQTAMSQATVNRSIPPSTTVSLGSLPDYLTVFTNGSNDANWQGATKGFCGDMFINGAIANERTSGNVPFGGTIYTNKNELGDWQDIINDNPGQSHVKKLQTEKMAGLITDFDDAMANMAALSATPGYTSVSATSLNGLNTMDGVAQTIVINITSNMHVTSQINITGDDDDMYILRWDTDANSGNGYQGTVKFSSGGAIVPQGELKATNFINVAGNISSSGGGSTPSSPYPQGPRFNNGTGALVNGGADFNGGGFFTGYWLTTGDPVTGITSSLSNAVFVGGWYTSSTRFSMTSGTSGVHVKKPQVLN